MKIVSSNAPKVKQGATNDVPQEVDTERLSAALTAAIRILRPGTTAQVRVTKRGDAK